MKNYNKQRLQELAGIKIKESEGNDDPEIQGDVFKTITLKMMVERDKPNTQPPFKYLNENNPYAPISGLNLIYDFGGGEYHLRGNNVTVVDYRDYWGKEEWTDHGHDEYDERPPDNQTIFADLDKSKVSLPPAQLINCKNFIDNTSGSSILANNIDSNLKSGGYLRTWESTFVLSTFMKNLSNYKIIEYIQVEDSDIFYALFQK